MRVSVVRIGNSKGVRIPKAILEQCHIGNEVELEVEDGKVILEPIEPTPRAHWDTAFAEMAHAGDDELLIDDAVDLDSGDWEW